MIYFEDVNINLEQITPENMHRLKAYLQEMSEKLNLLSEQVENLKKESNE